MSDLSDIRPYSVIKRGTVFVILVSIAAWCSNPDESNFRRWFTRASIETGETPAEKLAGAVVAPVLLAAMDWERIDYGFFSVVVFFNEPHACYLGAFGIWFPFGK